MSTIIPKEHLSTVYVCGFRFLKDSAIISLLQEYSIKINTIRSKPTQLTSPLYIHNIRCANIVEIGQHYSNMNREFCLFYIFNFISMV